MASEKPLNFRWGIISTGMIANKFAKDLLVDPKTREVHDVVHEIAAVGSRSVQKATEFINEVAGGDKSIKAYGSYEEVYADSNIDAIYIGTPHTHHYVNALDAIKAKKHVLCEKPVTLNAAELHSLLDAAKKNNVFFMEAMWTRFHPLAKALKAIAEEGTLGSPVTLRADLSMDFNIEKLPKSHRILDPQLGGGALLDLGPYPLVWAIIAIYEHPSNNANPPSSITASMVKTPLTGVDQNTTFNITFPSPLSAQANLTCNLDSALSDPCVSIQYEKGTITISPPTFCPKSFKVQYFTSEQGGSVEREEIKNFEYVGHGLHFEADEVARCVRSGKIESELWGHEKSLLEMNVFDEVRRQGGYEYPKGLEQVL